MTKFAPPLRYKEYSNTMNYRQMLRSSNYHYTSLQGRIGYHKGATKPRHRG